MTHADGATTGPVTPHPLLTPGYRARLLIILMVANALNFMDRAILSVVAEPMRHGLGLSDAQIGVLQGVAFGVSYSLVALPSGRLAERRSRLWIIAGCITCFSIATGLCGIASGFAQLLVFRALVGIGEGGFMAPATSLLADHFRNTRRAFPLSIVLMGMPLGFLLGSLVGGAVVEALGWRQTMMVMALPGVLVSVVMLTLLREPPRGLADGTPPASAADTPSLLAVFRRMVTVPSFRHLAAATVLCSGAASSVGQYFLIFLARVHHLTLAQAGAAAGMVSFFSLGIGLLIGGAVADRLGRIDLRWYLWLPAIGVSVGAIFYAIGFQTRSVPVSIAITLVAGIAVFFYFPAALATVQNLSGVRMRTSAMAVISLLTGLFGTGLGPTIIGVVSGILSKRAFTGDFATACKGGRARELGSALDTACQMATAQGMRGAMLCVSVLFLWAALHFLLASRTIRADLPR